LINTLTVLVNIKINGNKILFNYQLFEEFIIWQQGEGAFSVHLSFFCHFLSQRLDPNPQPRVEEVIILPLCWPAFPIDAEFSHSFSNFNQVFFNVKSKIII